MICGKATNSASIRMWAITCGTTPTKTSPAGTDQVNTSRVTERAYVRVSHAESMNEINKNVTIEIKNTGHTPARVMGVRLGPLVLDKDEPLPAKPPYDTTVDQNGA